MALRIIKVDRLTEDHWEYARRNGFWDLRQRYQLNDGDIVVFWRGGSPGKVLGQATVVGSVGPLPALEPHAWSPGDSRRGQYAHRVALADFVELPQIPVTYEQFGLRGQSPVLEVPEGVTREFVRRVGVRISLADIAVDQFSEALANGAEEPLRFDEDHRVRVPISAVIRRGAPTFRRKLMSAYGGRCAVTATSIPGLLEAAHIARYRGDHTDTVPNGLLLRADIHTLFDLHLITVLPDLTVRVAPVARAEPYAAYDERTIVNLPTRPKDHPAEQVLRAHNEACSWLRPVRHTQ